MHELTLKPERIEVMHYLALKIDNIIDEFLKKIDTNWQPADFLPGSSGKNFTDEIKELQSECKDMPDDYLAVLVGDAITEEALPTYESWLMEVDGISKTEPKGWSKWMRMWTAEENRHGDLLNKFLYLSGRINMQQMEISTQHLIADGMDTRTAKDPYKNFVYTSFQELATNISHRRTATLAKQHGSDQLSRICGVIASDEARHAKAYKSFVTKIFEVDPSEMMLAFEDMMRRRIVMPAHFLRQAGESIGKTFAHFSDAAQRLGVYTSLDYTHILESLIKEWNISNLGSLTGAAEKARDYLMSLPERFKKIAERQVKPAIAYEYKFDWIQQLHGPK